MPTERDGLRHPEPLIDPRFPLAVEELLSRERVPVTEVPRAPNPGTERPRTTIRPPRQPPVTRPGRPARDRPQQPRSDKDVEVELDAKRLQTLFRKAGPSSVVWSGPAGELEVLIAMTRVAVRPGVVLVALTADTDQTGRHELVVPLMVGTEDRHLGMTLGGQKRAVGHSPLAALWSEALTAHAWSTLLTIAESAIGFAVSELNRDTKTIQSKPGAMFTREDTLVVRSRSGVSVAEVFTVRPR